MTSIDTILGNVPAPTAAEIKAALAMTIAVAEAIRELGSVPSGHLYAQMMGKVDLSVFEAMIRSLVNAGLVKNERNTLTWVGPHGKKVPA